MIVAVGPVTDCLAGGESNRWTPWPNAVVGPHLQQTVGVGNGQEKSRGSRVGNLRSGQAEFLRDVVVGKPLPNCDGRRPARHFQKSVAVWIGLKGPDGLGMEEVGQSKLLGQFQRPQVREQERWPYSEANTSPPDATTADPDLISRTVPW